MRVPRPAEDEHLPLKAPGLRGLLDGPTRYAEALTRTVQELARSQSALLVGTAGAEILRDYPQALHLRLVARREDRIRRISEEADVDAESAVHLIEESDYQRAEFHTTLFGMPWADPHYYHLVLNTSLLDTTQVVTLLVLALRVLQLTTIEPPGFTAPACWRHVTISREYGSGGHECCARLAERLQWACFDHEAHPSISGLEWHSGTNTDSHRRAWAGIRRAITHHARVGSLLRRVA